MSSPELLVGSRLLYYRVEGLLGRGGMGEVYLAEDLRLRRRVALKLLAPALAGDVGFRDRFLAESKLAASLDHPCVIPIYEAGEADGRLFIAMRYVEGGDLRQYLRSESLSQEHAIAVCGDVADGLDFAHERGLIHGDVKPSNILLDARAHVYLADFGLSRQLTEPRLLEDGLRGTIDYLAPEQIRGEPIDGRADAYSLGCVLYECLLGEPPFRRLTDAAVLYAHLEEEPLMPARLKAVLRKALAKQPAERYASCAELVQATRGALKISRRGSAGPLPPRVRGDDLVCPYKGLAFFDRSDADFFSGRERLVGELVARIESATLVGILGPSGVGKSSPLRAGLLPALSAGALPGSAGWPQRVLRPGTHPQAELARALDGTGIAARHPRPAGDGRIVIAVDQLEEVFTACRSDDERRGFLGQLAAVARDHRGLVLVAMRADFYGRLIVCPAFAELLSDSHALVGPLSDEDLARAISEPATRAGLEVEPELVRTLVADVAGEPGGLPLLSAMLLELYRTRRGRTLRLESYRTSGGVHGAVARLAENALIALGEHERGVAREVMLRLVRTETAEPVRRRVPVAELERIDGAAPVLAALTGSRLLTITDLEVEMSHEALLREWPRYRGWLEEDQAGRRLYAHLAGAAREWDASGRDPAELYRGARLAAAIEWAAQSGAQLDPLERDFLDRGRQLGEGEQRRQRSQNRRLRSLLLAVVALLVLAAITATIAVVKQRAASDQARVSLARQLGAEARSEPRIDVAMLLAREGVKLDPSPQTEGDLLATLQSSPSLIRTFPLPANAAGTPAVSPDGRTLAFGDALGQIRFIDVGSGRLAPAHVDCVVAQGPPVYSADGSLLACGGLLGVSQEIDVRDARTFAPVAKLVLGTLTSPKVPFEITGGSIALAPDRRAAYYAYWLGTGSPAAYLKRYALPSGRSAYRIRVGSEPLLAMRLIDHGRRLVIVGAQHVWTFDAPSLRLRGAATIVPRPREASTAAISPDGRTVIVGAYSGAVSFADTAGGRLRAAGSAQGAPVVGALYARDGATAVTVTADDTITTWNPRSGRSREILSGPPAHVAGAALSPDGRTLYASTYNGPALVWDLAGNRRFGARTRLGAAGNCCGLLVPPAPPLAVAPDGSRFAALVGRSGVGVFSIATRRRLSTLTIPRWAAPVTALEWSPAGHDIAVGASSGLIDLWPAGDRRPVTQRLRGLGRILGRPEAIQSLAFSPDGQTLAATDKNETRSGSPGSADELLATLRSWRVDSGAPAAPARDLGVGPDGPKDLIAFDPAQKLAAVSGLDGQVLILSSSGQVERTLTPTAPATALAFAPGGTLAIGSGDGTLQLWNPSSGQRLTRAVPVSLHPVGSIAFDAIGRRLATAGYGDGVVKLWLSSTLEQQGEGFPTETGTTSAVAFVPQRDQLLAVDDRGAAYSWPISVAVWKQRACAVAARNLSRTEWAQFVGGRPYQRVCP